MIGPGALWGATCDGCGTRQVFDVNDATPDAHAVLEQRMRRKGWKVAPDNRNGEEGPVFVSGQNKARGDLCPDCCQSRLGGFLRTTEVENAQAGEA